MLHQVGVSFDLRSVLWPVIITNVLMVRNFGGSYSVHFSEVQNVCCTATEHLVFSVATHTEHADSGRCLQTVHFYLRVSEQPGTES